MMWNMIRHHHTTKTESAAPPPAPHMELPWAWQTPQEKSAARENYGAQCRWQRQCPGQWPPPKTLNPAPRYLQRRPAVRVHRPVRRTSAG